MLYSFARSVLGTLSHILFRVQRKGVENVPSEGPVVICSNHISWWDPVLVASALRRPVHFMAKKELFRRPILAYLFRKLHAFPVNRGRPDLGAIKAGLSVLKSGGVLGIFPEGTRQRTGDHLGEMHAGAAMLALKAGTPVVPAAIRGKYKIGHPVVLVFGDSMVLEAKTGHHATDIHECAQVIGKAISDLWEGIREEETRGARRAVRSC